ncbi:glycosyltransferase [Asanoa siamensis]|uniref:Glycosyl transferase n=1 Tax=Asanoa siamensis TaxID=926357 RepID=A0ABQ4CLE4_9ACTN|nr:glycosyltransferase [Asanoa siamensis]GIF72109.1 glycosyl transferase [Asanoa siamensis]
MTATAQRPIAPTRTLLTEIVIPIKNEARVLEASVRRLYAYLVQHFPYRFRITIAESGATDASPDIARRLEDEFDEVRYVHIDLRGRGLALREVWAASDADIVCYMDADLSIDLDGFLPLIAPLASGHSDLSIGTRHAPSSSVRRSMKRAGLSRTYNFLLRMILGVRFSDAQCGFKAGRREVVQALLPVVHDGEWFFDTELLCVAEQHSLRIHEVPIDCLDDPDSSVNVRRTVFDMLRGIVRMSRRKLSGDLNVALPPHLRRSRVPTGLAYQFVRFAAIGAFTGLVHVLFYLGLREFLSPVTANAVALLLSTIINTAANRRITFGVRGRKGALRHQVEGGVAFALSLLFMSAALWAVGAGIGRLSEVVVLLAGDALATLARFTLLRHWVFARTRGRDT